MNFTEKLHEIKKIQDKLEKNDISLEEAMKEFEFGIKLIGECKTTLEEAAQRVSILTHSGPETYNGRDDK